MRGESGYPYLDAIKLTDQIDSVNSFSELSRADKISCLVAQTLHFLQYDQPRARLLTPDNLSQPNHETNCYGYAATTAEALSLAGITNYILYANRHALNLAVDNRTGERLIISSDDTRFNSLADEEILRIDNVLTSDDGNLRMAGILYTDRLVAQNSRINGGNIDAHRPWLDNNRRRNGQILDLSDNYLTGSGRYDRGHSLAVTVTSSAVGRSALQSLYNFEYDVYRNERHDTDANFDAMADSWLEIGRDNLRDNQYSLNRYLRDRVSEGDIAGAMTDAQRVSAGIGALTHDLSVRLWLPDFIRKAGTDSGDVKLLEQAKSDYEAVLADDDLSEQGIKLVQGKITKTERIIKSIK